MNLLPESIQHYAEQHTDTEPALLQELARETHLKVLYPRMLSGHFQGRLLAMLAKLLQPKTIVEVGTYTGYATLCLAEGLAPGGHIYTIDSNPETNVFAGRYFERAGLQAHITQLEGDAVAILQNLTDVAPDLVFLDARKEDYITYYELLLPRMPAGGVLLTDNVLWSGKVADPSFSGGTTDALRAFNTHIRTDPRVDRLLLPLRDGLYLIRKR